MKRKVSAYINDLDFTLVLTMLALLTIGILSIYASEYELNAVGSQFLFSKLYVKQMLWAALGISIFILILLIDYRTINTLSYLIYAISILLLFLVVFIGKDVNNARSWIDLGFMKFQPSEFAKVATLLALSEYLSSSNFSVKNKKQLIISIAIILMPIGLIIFQNDMGTALTFFAFFLVFYRAGISGRVFVVCFLVFIALLLGFMMPIHRVIITYFSLLLASLVIMKFRFQGSIISITIIVLLYSLYVYTGWLFVDSLSIIALSLVSLIIIPFFVLKKIRKRYTNFVITGMLFVLLALVSMSSGYVFNNFLKPHQQNRIAILMGKEQELKESIQHLSKEVKQSDIIAQKKKTKYTQLVKAKQELKDLRAGPLWNIRQSLIAISSGGFSGKGYLKGTQNKLSFLPEQSTDFIFCSIAEEWGFLGVSITLLLFLWLLFRIVNVSEQQPSKKKLYFGYGVVTLLFTHIFINIGMVVGLLPVIGIPLPFISYGGSSIISLCIMMGIFINPSVK